MTQYRAIRGMVDILPDDTPQWQYTEAVLRRALASYGYQEIRLPLIEGTDLFVRSIGEVTDIVEKEMYTFADRNEQSLSLRPEGTAGCVRAVVQHNRLATPQKLWYQGPMFRYERPQKGRQRQFHQLGVEAFGVATPDQDAELLLLCHSMWQDLGVSGVLTLELNSIGSPAAREAFKAALVAYLTKHLDALDEDSKRRLATNPLRILDSKEPQTQAVLNDAPRMSDYLDDESRADFARLRALLDAAGVSYKVNNRLVRGLDYYNKTVFEWTTTALGAQGTVCGGGRYDGMVEQFGGKQTPAAGFAIGLERLVLLVQTLQRIPEPTAAVYVITAHEQAYIHALPRVEALRHVMVDESILMHLGGGSFKSQFKRADKSGARVALVYGDEEVERQIVTVKPLRGGEQKQIHDADLVNYLTAILNEERQGEAV